MNKNDVISIMQNSIKKIDSKNINQYYKKLCKLEKDFDTQQSINIFHQPFGYGMFNLLMAKSLGTYEERANDLAKKLNQKQRHGFQKAMLTGKKASKMPLTKINENSKLSDIYDFYKKILDIKKYMNKGYTNKSTLFFMNYFGIKYENYKVVQDKKLFMTCMPLTKNIIKCCVYTDINDLENGKANQELRQLAIQNQQPVQLGLF